jgi:CheY-like chemotaxis protein
MADDSSTIHKAVRLTLSEKEFRVLSAQDGKSALDLVGAHKVDLILADINMPELSGYDLCHRVKSKTETAHIPVILMCGTFDRFDQDKFIACKANHRIWKPFETSTFLEMIRRFTYRRDTPSTTLSETHTREPQHTKAQGAGPALSGVLLEAPDFSQRPSTPLESSAKAELSPGEFPPRRSTGESSPTQVWGQGSRSSAVPAQVSTQNPTVPVEKALTDWLNSEVGREFLRGVIQREFEKLLTGLEKNLLEQMKKVAWDEDGDGAIRVVHPKSSSV